MGNENIPKVYWLLIICWMEDQTLHSIFGLTSSCRYSYLEQEGTKHQTDKTQTNNSIHIGRSEG